MHAKVSNTKNAILVPGRPDKDEHYDPKRPSNSEDHWFSWLKRQLILQDIHAVAIEPPFPFRPRYDEWKKELERFDLTPETMLVGHSCGGGFLVRYLSEHKNLTVGTVVLVAPWMNPDNAPGTDTADFFTFEIDPDLAARTKKLIIFNSDNDYASVRETVQILRGTIKDVTYREFHAYGHFCLGDMETKVFPELLEELTNT